MFQEINPSYFKEPEPNKSWFRDGENNCDLFIWKDQSQQIVRFQLWHEDILIEWEAGKGFRSGLLDPEVGAFRSYQSPSFRYHHQLAQNLVSEVKKRRLPVQPSTPLPEALRFVRQLILQQS